MPRLVVPHGTQQRRLRPGTYISAMRSLGPPCVRKSPSPRGFTVTRHFDARRFSPVRGLAGDRDLENKQSTRQHTWFPPPGRRRDPAQCRGFPISLIRPYLAKGKCSSLFINNVMGTFIKTSEPYLAKSTEFLLPPSPPPPRLRESQIILVRGGGVAAAIMATSSLSLP
jgi:hypothetical protein